MIFLCISIVIVSLLAILLGISFVLFGYAAHKSAVRSPEQLIERMKLRYKDDPVKSKWGYMAEEAYNKLLKQPLQDVYITSRDGLKLHATLVECPNASKTVVFSHGWRSNTLFDFSCVWEYYFSHGFNLLFVDHRAHGKSEGTYITFGIKERYDLIDWIKFINSRFGEDKKIFLSGISMGSSTVMMALGSDELPSNVVGASCDCGYTSPSDIFKHVLKQKFHLPSFPFVNISNLISRLISKTNFNEFSSLEGLKKAKIPIVFIHGTHDGFVPIDHTYKNMEVCASPYTKVIVENATHGMSYLTDRDSVMNGIKSLHNSIFENFE